MNASNDTFTDEVRCPLLWQPDKPPLFVGSAGRIRHAHGRLLDVMQSYYIGMIYGVQGIVAVETTAAVHKIQRGQACLIDHGTRFQVKILSDFGEFLYLSIDGEDSANLMARHDLWEGVFRSGQPPVATIQEIMRNLPETQKKAIQVNLVSAMDLLTFIQTQHYRTAPDKLVLDTEILLHRHWNDPAYNVNALHGALKVNRSSLSDRFKSQTEKTMLEYLHDIRLYRSVHILKETAMSINEVARACGFSDAAYFSRFIRKKTGNSPNELRRNEGNGFACPSYTPLADFSS